MRYVAVIFFLALALSVIWLFFGPAIRAWGKRFSGTLEDSWDAVEEQSEEESEDMDQPVDYERDDRADSGSSDRTDRPSDNG